MQKYRFFALFSTGLWTGLLLFTFSNLQAQCSGVFSSGPVTVGGVGSCVPISGMMQWNGTTLQVYDGSTWTNIPGTGGGSGYWSANSNGIHYDESNGDNVGVGLDLPTSKLHIFDVMNVNQSSAQRIDFQNTSTLSGSFGLYSEGATKTTKGYQVGVAGKTFANYGGKTGESYGSLGTSSVYDAGGSFYGVIGNATSTALSTFSSTHSSSLIGGSFNVSGDTDISLDDGIFWIGGSYASLSGTINNTPVNGAVAAVIGRDLSQGTAQSWAGYFEGKGYFSDFVGIGTQSPDSKLHVKGGTIRIEHDDGQPWEIHGSENAFAVKDVDLNHYRLWIRNDNGNTGIDTTNPSEKLDVNGNIRANSIQVSSDKRYKKDIKTLKNSLEKITQLRGTEYDYRINEFKYINFDDRHQIGFIAQEIQAVLPELVHEDQNGYLSVNYQGLIPVLTEAIKELKSENDVITAENEQLKTDFSALQDRIQKLEQLLTNNEDSNPKTSTTHVLIEDKSELVSVYPNPFKNIFTINYQLKEASTVTIKIVDNQGKAISALLDEDLKQKGIHQVNFNAENLASGIYYYTIETDEYFKDGKIIKQ